MKLNVPPSLIVWIIVFSIFVALVISAATNFASADWIMANFMVFVLLIVTIATLAIIGATFLGIVISHRILAGRGFSPFEEEMLKMREEVKEMKQKLDMIEIKEGGRLEVKVQDVKTTPEWAPEKKR